MNYFKRKRIAIMRLVEGVKGFIRNISGIPPITLPDCVDNDSLISYSISGNSVQNGEPTPENPIEVESVGEYDEETGKYKIPVVCSDGQGNSVTKNIYLDEPLRRIGNYADYVDFENQKIVRKICSEYITTVGGISTNFLTYRVYLSIISKKPLITKHSSNVVILTNKFIQAEKVSYGYLSEYPNSCLSYITSLGANRVAYTFADASLRTVEEGQTALGDGFEVNYVLAEPTETPISLPKLPTVKGTTIYSIETAVQPSNMCAEYYSTSKGE